VFIEASASEREKEVAFWRRAKPVVFEARALDHRTWVVSRAALPDEPGLREE
jgi:hypothetical protein